MKAHILIALSIIIFSCSKPSGDDSPGGGNGGNTIPDNSPKIKTRTTATETTTYTYDTNKKIIAETSTSGLKAEYTFSAGEVKKIFTNNGLPNSSFTYYLNADGLSTKVVRIENGSTESEFTYNPDKTMSIEMQSAYKLEYFFKNGNLDSIRSSELNGNWFGTISFTYYLDQSARFNYENFGQFFLGKGSLNNIKSRHERYPGTLVRHYDIEYSYDATGKTIIQKTTDINGTVSLQTYTYY